ncbi:tRNA (adenosine(37)-N6)-threonylcarbamoyltransferase complex dimerization subunit type 1 TsaB [Halorhodospira halochloris]|uniref:tRNA (adenosine(37)-N6)-threonylcarbamoyltransferase complex dimerization subunit type 1 TsaB n=1 Tax=Halorhodospira halochloris TaxID=1052 RepID=UPI001EE94F36|nr:tRNA (adenosine(37)-N6)-threonylcarbamoyltransferase complex dimerization subunit type 1 TsaB [Halorhodospira halochloris]MCG5548702.1 tRNA (adenosine(37)-N6)-threonylcarbamoyltransferase complex dimerization subunit type 1 TsaB [Halorhodospira halochloris]
MNHSVIIAIETATEGCSVAVDTAHGVVERFIEAPREHSARLLPMLEEAMAEAEISSAQVAAVAFGRGPGAFVGVRLAASVAQGLCSAWQVPALPVSTLEALAAGAAREHGASRVIAALDARMGQVYWGAYSLADGQLMEAESAEAVADPEQLAAGISGGISGRDYFGVGRGFAAYSHLLPRPRAGLAADSLPRAEDLLPRARSLLAAGQAAAPDQALPVYLREGV